MTKPIQKWGILNILSGYLNKYSLALSLKIVKAKK